MAKNKSLKMLSTASVAGMVAAAVVSSQAFAAVDAYSVKVDNDVFQYSKADLTDSFLAAKAGEAAPLYEDFLARFEKASGFYAFHDNKTEKYVSVADITEKYLEAKAAGTEFVVDTYTESKDAKVLEVPTVKKVVVKDGKVVIEEDQQQGELKVESISAINAKQFKIVFNQEVDKTSAEKVSNYTVTGINLADAYAELQADGKTVILTVDNNTANDPGTEAKLTNYSKYNVTVKNVKNKSERIVSDTTIVNIQLSDVSIPTFDKVVVSGPNKIKVYFSEPVKAVAGDFTLDNGSIAVSNAKVLPSQYAVELTLSADLANGDHKLVINNTAIDYVGYAVAKTENVFVYTKDTTAPTVQISKAAPDKITLKFDKAVKNVDKAEIKVGYNRITNITSDSGNSEDTVWYINMGSNYITGTSVTVSIKNNAEQKSNRILDRWSNELADVTLNADIVADTLKPEVTGLEVLNESQVKVSFNKKVNRSDAENRMNYTLFDKNGNVAKISGVTDSYGHPLSAPSYDDDNKVVTVTFGGNLLPENYSLKVEGISDVVSYNKQKIDAKTLAFSVADKAKLQLNTAAWDSTNRKITLSFTKSVAQSGDYNALDVKNYTIGGKALPTGSSVALGGSDKIVVITLGGTDIPSGNLVATIKDSQGYLIDVTKASAPIGTAIINENADIQKVKLVDNNTVTFEVLQPLSKVVAQSVSVNSIAVSSASFVNQNVKKADGTIVYGSVVTLNTDKNIPASALGTIGGTWNINLPAGALETVAGAVSTGTVINKTVEDYAAPEITAIATNDSQANGMIDKIIVTYSEAILAADVSKEAYSVDGYTVKDAYVSDNFGARQPASSAQYVTLELEESGRYDTSAKPVVKQIKDVRDAAENAKKAEANSSVATSDKALPVIISAVLNSSKDALTVTFSESVTASSTGNGTFAGLTGGFTNSLTGGASATVSGHTSSLANVVTFTVTGGSTILSTDTVAASATSIYDFVGNAAPTTAKAISGSVITATGITGSGSQVTAGIAPTPLVPGTPGVYDVAVGTSDITIDSKLFTYSATPAQTGKWNDATELAALINADAALNVKYNAVAGTGKVTLTQKAGQESATQPTSDATVTEVTPGVAEVAATAGTKEVNKLALTGTATATGKVQITFNDGVGTPVVKTIAVQSGTTATAVAADIATAFSGLTGYTVTSVAGDVTFTANTAAADQAVTISLVNVQ